MPSPSSFSLSVIYLSAIETHICHTEIEVNRVYLLRSGTKYDTWFSKYDIKLVVALSSTNVTKRIALESKCLNCSGFDW